MKAEPPFVRSSPRLFSPSEQLWLAASGLGFVTFGAHDAGVTALAWAPSGGVLVSASLDGTVRAHDVGRRANAASRRRQPRLLQRSGPWHAGRRRRVHDAVVC